jgi:tight adherence protein B
MTAASVKARLRGEGQPPATTATPTTVALAAAGLAIAWWSAGPTTSLLLAAGAAAWTVSARIRAATGARRRRIALFPAALDALATSLRSGASLPTALAEAAAATPPPLGPELAALATSTTRGRPMAAALDDWSTAHDDRTTRLAATAMILATRVGTAPARAVEGVAATLRERLDLAGERRALAAQARASTLVLATAPLVFGMILLAGDEAAADFLLRTPAGWASLTIGIGLDAVGAWWMARLTRGQDP